MEASAIDQPFDIERDAPHVLRALERTRPDIVTRLERVRRELPSGVDCGTRVSLSEGTARHSEWFRFPRQYRSFAVPLDVDRASPFDVDVLVFKGMELLLADFPRYLQWMAGAQFRRSELPIALHLPFMLRMPPGAMPVDEAQREQELAAELQSRHLEAYGALAHTPVPLLVQPIDSSGVRRYLARLEEVLPSQAFERIDARCRAGLAISISYYPSAPIRLNSLLAPVPDAIASYSARVLADPDALVNRWIELLARLLLLEFMPFVPWNAGWGACMDAGNACLDGGFTDLVTLTRFETITDDRLFAASVAMTLEMFANTVATLCRRFAPPFSAFADNPRTPTHVLPYVTRRLEQALHEQRRNLSPDPRLLAAISPSSIRDLVKNLEPIVYDTDDYDPIR